MVQASKFCASRGGDCVLSATGGSCCGGWGSVFVRWTELRVSIRSPECDECQVWLPAALATHILLRSRHPATSLAALAGTRCKRESCAGRFALSSEVQSGGKGRQV